MPGLGGSSAARAAALDGSRTRVARGVRLVGLALVGLALGGIAPGGLGLVGLGLVGLGRRRGARVLFVGLGLGRRGVGLRRVLVGRLGRRRAGRGRRGRAERGGRARDRLGARDSRGGRRDVALVALEDQLDVAQLERVAGRERALRVEALPVQGRADLGEVLDRHLVPATLERQVLARDVGPRDDEAVALGPADGQRALVERDPARLAARFADDEDELSHDHPRGIVAHRPIPSRARSSAWT